MPRAGLSRGGVVAAAAELADEVGFTEMTMGLLAQRLGIRTPSLYKHVADLADLKHATGLGGVGQPAVQPLGESVPEAVVSVSAVYRMK